MSQTIVGGEDIRYVVGLAFLAGRRSIILQRKKRPNWQAGYLNGPGGKCERGEGFLDAMNREWEEEVDMYMMDAGYRQTVTPAWSLFVTLNYGTAAIAFFAADLPPGTIAKEKTDEKIELGMLNQLPNLKVIPNLQWLIPMGAHHVGREPIRAGVINISGQSDAISPMKGMMAR